MSQVSVVTPKPNHTGHHLLENLNTVTGYKKHVNGAILLNSLNNFNLSSTKLNYSLIKSEDSFFLTNTHLKLNYGEITPEVLSNLNFFTQKLFLLNINSSLGLGKQSRWLIKSSILSNKIIENANSITHLKKLFGSAALNQSSLSYNIWLSSRSSSEGNFSKLNNSFNIPEVTSKLNTNLNLKMPSAVFDNFENSIFWVVKRFKFLQSMSQNNQVINFNLPNATPNYIKDIDNKVTPLTFASDFILHNYTISQKPLNLYTFTHLNTTNVSNFPNFNFNEYQGHDMLSASDANFIKFITQDNSSGVNLNIFYSCL